MHILTALSVELDFSVEGDSRLDFPSSGVPQTSCVTLNITNDGIVDAPDVFCLTLESSDLDVIINASTGVTCITIVNVDSKQLHVECKPFSLSLHTEETRCSMLLAKADDGMQQ